MGVSAHVKSVEIAFLGYHLVAFLQGALTCLELAKEQDGYIFYL